MADVAKLAGVSVTTVSFVLNDRPDTGLRQETKDRVRAAVEQLGYRRHQPARALVMRSSQAIGFVGERLGSPFGGRIISGVHDVARAHGSVLLIVDAEDHDELGETIEVLLDRRVDGILVAADATQRMALPRSVGRIPTIMVNCLAAGGQAPSVLPDEEVGGRTAARLLLEAGHRDVAYLAGSAHMWATKMRVKGFRSEFAAAGISPRAVQVRYGNYHADSGYTLCRELMAKRRHPSALFMGNDRMALGAYFALAELGLRIPEDVSVVGYDDQEEFADSMRPALSTISLPFYEMGRVAAEALLDQPPDARPPRRMVPCPPVMRASLAPVGAFSESQALPA